MSESQRSKSMTWLMWLLLVCLAAAAGWNSVSSGFVSDDFILADIAGRVPVWRLFRANWLDEQGAGGFYRPVTDLFWKLDLSLYGLDARGYHITNILLHIAVVLLAFRLVHRLSGRRSVAFTASALFALHPIHTEAIAWISGRTDLTASLFYLWGLVVFLGKPGNHPEHAVSPWRYAAVLLLGVLAMLSKEVAYTFPLMVTAAAFPDSRRTARKPGWFFGLLWLTPVGMLLLRRLALGTFIGGYGAARHLRFDAILFGYFKFYLRWMLAPLDIAARHDSPVETIIGAGAVGLLLLALFHRRYRYGAVFFLVSVLPVLNICRPQYLYLPSLGLLWLAAEFISSPRFRTGYLPRAASLLVVAALLSSYLVETMQKNFEWTRTARVGLGIRDVLLDLHPHPAHGTRVVFINPPVNLRIPIGVFQNGLTQAIRLWYNDPSLSGLKLASAGAYTEHRSGDIVFEFKREKIIDRTPDFSGRRPAERPWCASAGSFILNASAPAKHIDGCPDSLSGICIYSQMSNAAGLEQGTPVADITVFFDAAAPARYTLKAGLDTAEWAWDRPDVRAVVAHRRAPIAYSYIADDTREPPVIGHAYRSVLTFNTDRPVSGLDITLRSPDIPPAIRPHLQLDIKSITGLPRKDPI